PKASSSVTSHNASANASIGTPKTCKPKAPPKPINIFTRTSATDGRYEMLLLPETSLASNLLEDVLHPLPGLVAGFLVRFVAGRIFPLAHETMARAFVGERFVFFPRGFHQFFGLRDGGIHTVIVPTVKAVHGRFDPFDVRLVLGAGPVKG